MCLAFFPRFLLFLADHTLFCSSYQKILNSKWPNNAQYIHSFHSHTKGKLSTFNLYVCFYWTASRNLSSFFLSPIWNGNIIAIISQRFSYKIYLLIFRLWPEKSYLCCLIASKSPREKKCNNPGNKVENDWTRKIVGGCACFFWKYEICLLSGD